MNPRLARLQTRRTQLQAQAGRERDEIARLAGAVMAPLAIGDRALQLIRSTPVLIGGAVALAAILRPGRALAWTVRAWALWQAWRRIRDNRGRKT
jgi:hypothetical protein